MAAMLPIAFAFTFKSSARAFGTSLKAVDVTKDAIDKNTIMVFSKSYCESYIMIITS
jgi:hypothetical protein